MISYKFPLSRKIPSIISMVRDSYPYMVIAASVLLASLRFLWPSPIEFPMDDAYIHFVYAQNLAESGALYFNSPSEVGVGSTSLLWILLLTAGKLIGFSLPLIAKMLGISSLVIVGCGIYTLLRPVIQKNPALLSALFATLSGNMLWFALNGMETTLFLALGILSLLLHRSQHWFALGISLGLLVITRPEGAVLAVAIALFEIWRHRTIKRNLLIMGLTSALISVPWFAYLLFRTEYLLPTTIMGKQLLVSEAINQVSEHNRFLAILANIPVLKYFALWLGYLLEFALGGASLPPPHLLISVSFANLTIPVSIWALFGWAIVIAPLIISAGRQLRLLKVYKPNTTDVESKGLYIFLIWLIGHNFAYSLFLPSPGTAGRYGAINYVALWVALSIGLLSFAKKPRIRLFLGVGLSLIASMNTIYWISVYEANLDHMQNVRIQAARFVKDNLDSPELCASFDIGALRYHRQGPILDLGGLIDPSYGEWYRNNAIDKYLMNNGATCLIGQGPSSTSSSNSWFDAVDILGLSTSSQFELLPVKRFEIEYSRWMQGYLPTGNYAPALTVYKIVER